MKILVAYASKYGSTKGIAEFIGEKLRESGKEAVVKDVGAVQDLGAYDAFVIGSAAFMGHWMKEAKQFVLKHQAVLSAKPVWLFSSGPIGTQKVGAKGRDVLEASRPVEFKELEPLIKPRGFRVFFGSLHADKLTGIPGFMFRAVRKIKAARENMPEGDFRDWKEIEAWTRTIG